MLCLKSTAKKTEIFTTSSYPHLRITKQLDQLEPLDWLSNIYVFFSPIFAERRWRIYLLTHTIALKLCGALRPPQDALKYGAVFSFYLITSMEQLSFIHLEDRLSGHNSVPGAFCKKNAAQLL